MRTVVVGAGLGGLSAACHLAGPGHEVVVVDREAAPSGRAGIVEDRGFRIDSGPTVLTMVGLLDQTFAAAAVVCNVDVAFAYRSLLGLPPPRLARRGRYSPSCVVWLAGVRGTLSAGAAHHNVHFGTTWREAFAALLDDGRRMPDPSVLVTTATASDPTLAPPACATLFVLEPAPNLDGHVDWYAERRRLRDELATRVGALGYPVEDVVVERLTDPDDWEGPGLERGTPFALAHRFFQTGPFRPRNVDRRIPGLAFTGMGTVPGVGIPMVLISGRLAADRVDEWAGARFGALASQSNIASVRRANPYR